MTSHPRLNHLSFLAAALLGGLASTASASLEWTQRQAAAQTRANRPSVEVDFPFTNTGDTSVTIQSVFTGCGCTAPGRTLPGYALPGPQPRAAG